MVTADWMTGPDALIPGDCALDLAARRPDSGDMTGIGQHGDVRERVGVQRDDVGVVARLEPAAARGLRPEGQRRGGGRGLDCLPVSFIASQHSSSR